MRTTPSSSPRMAKSTSLAVLEHDHGQSMHIVDQDDIIGLTQDVKNFSDGLAKLKAVCTEEYECEEDMRVVAHERLGDVLCTLKSVLQRYPPLNTTELFSAAATLIGKIKNYNYEDHSHDSMENAFSDAIDQLALEFSSSVSEYLMGDLHHGIVEDLKTKSYDNLLSVSQETTDKDETEDEKEEIVRLTPEQIDATLMNLEAGLELAFQRAKAWSKYLKDVMAYIERRAQLEVEYSKNLSRLAASVKPQLTEEGFLPLQSVYCTVLSQDVEFAKTCQATFTMLQTTKFVEPLTARKNEHDKVRKVLKDNWNKEVKRMHEAVNNLKKAQSLYITRQQEYEKARELSQKAESELLGQSGGLANLSGKMDKRKKAVDDASHKAAEAETTYKACVAEANNRQTDVQRVKCELLAAIREQIYFSDQAIRKVTIEYFQLLQTVSAPIPVQYHTLCEASKRYDAGSQYAEFVRRLPTTSSTPIDYEEFKFEPYQNASSKGDIGTRKTSTQSNESVSSEHHSQEDSPNLNSPRRDKYRVPVKAWGQQGLVLGSDTDSQSGSSKSLDSSPSSSPYPAAHKKMALTGSMDDLIEDTSGLKQLLAVPGTEQLSVQSIVKRGRRNTTFGVDFQEQVEHYHSAVPPIISKSLKEVEKRGIDLKGIYRVSGVKSTVENLCQRFEMDPESISLDNENPNVISNVLKLYLRQLPEPLLTFKLYPNFISVAKENMSGGCNSDGTVEKLHNLIDQLPFSNRKTLGVLMHHLSRVAEHVEQNQMNASNLGIVFGPTLLRPQGGNASLACLVDTPHQTRVVELLIVWANTLFGPSEDHQLIHGVTMVEQMERNSTLIVTSQATVQLPKNTKTEPKREVPSPSLTLPKDHLLPPNVPQTGKDSKESSPLKATGDELSLPGTTHFDRDLSPKSITSIVSPEGRDSDIVYGLANENSGVIGLANENSADSDDIQSDDDLILPDDSNRVSISQLEVKSSQKEGSLKTRALNTPLLGRSRLPSPASSPNLSVRSSYSSPPAIKVENSVLTDTSQTPPTTQYQLPPVNTWVPKGESLFTSILDSRSPQVYRRTNITKQAPLQSESPGNLGSRVSWPQGLQSQTSPDLSATADLQKSQTLDVSTEDNIDGNSPRLLKKCTSFDQERSKPFPNRSSMTSPMLVRKAFNVDDTDGPVNFVLSDSPSSIRKSVCEPDIKAIEHVDEKKEAELAIDVPECLSTEYLPSPEVKTITAVSEHQSDMVKLDHSKVSVIKSDVLKRQSQVLDEHYNESRMNQVEVDANRDIVLLSEKLDDYKHTDSGAKPKRIKSSEVGKPPATKSEVQTTKQSDITKKKESVRVSKDDQREAQSAVKGKGLLKSTKKDSTSYSVKSALMSSAAKLKSLSKRNPVTLLSYKSHSISIPDHTNKSRPSSLTSFGHDKDPSKRLVHQCESSPTVLQSVGDDRYTREPDLSVKRSTTAGFDYGSVPSVSTSSPMVRKAVSQTTPTKPTQSQPVSPKQPILKSKSSVKDKTGVKEKLPAMVRPKESVGKSVLSRSYNTEKQTQSSSSKTSTSGVVKSQKTFGRPISTKGPTPLATSARKDPSSASKAPASKASPGKTVDDKKKVKHLKRDSIGSIHSDSSRKSDHAHDCCSCKKTAEKKSDHLQGRKKLPEKK